MEITITPEDIAAWGARQGELNVPVEKLTVSVNYNVCQWTVLEVEQMGTGIAEDITAVKVWSDNNKNGTIEEDYDIMIGNDVEVTIVDVRGDKVRLGITAPKEIPVHRMEVYEAIKREEERSS